MEPDLTIVALTFGCLLVVLIILLMSISAARRLQYRKRQALDQKDVGERRPLLLGGRREAIQIRRRLEALLADLIEERLCKQEHQKVLALEPDEVDNLLSEIPRGSPQPQAFEEAFGALHELAVKFKSFCVLANRQFQHATRDVALEISGLQKEILSMLEPIKQRLKVYISLVLCFLPRSRDVLTVENCLRMREGL